MFERTDPADVSALASAAGETVAFESAICCAVWLFMSYVNAHSRGDFPRIFSTVLFVISTRALPHYFDGGYTTGTVVALLFAGPLRRAIRRRVALRQARASAAVGPAGAYPLARPALHACLLL